MCYYRPKKKNTSVSITNSCNASCTLDPIFSKCTRTQLDWIHTHIHLFGFPFERLFRVLSSTYFVSFFSFFLSFLKLKKIIMLQEPFSHINFYEEDDEDYSPSSSTFESCSSDVTDDSTVVSTSSSLCMKEDYNTQDYSLVHPPIILPFLESLSFDMLRLYQVKCIHTFIYLPCINNLFFFFF